mmetsp:Transcript_27524/g.59741  ORF Transcript_27524/g.59741 Transcript_27524/m.59741 type:complete len:127 (+) Transcript_27524:84-464(+)
MATMGAMREETKAAGDARVAAMSQAEAALALEKQRADNAVSEVSAMRQNMEDLQRRVEDQMASAAAGEEEERRRGEHVRSQLRRVEDDMVGWVEDWWLMWRCRRGNWMSCENSLLRSDGGRRRRRR